MACFERASPALREILFKIHRAERPLEIDHHVHEFGSVHYHVQSSASEQPYTYLSISTPLLSRGFPMSSELPEHTLEMVRGICPDVVEIVETPREGYQLTLKINLARIPHSKASTKMITDISSVQAVILSSQLKEILRNVDSYEVSRGLYKPIKLIYHPREPFFVIKQPLQTAELEEDQPVKKKAKGCRRVRKWISASKLKILKRKDNFTNKIKRIRSRIKIHGFGRFRRRWLPKFSPVTRYIKLE
ncbi:UNVERIFIED_CONTAM: Actin-related protein 2/3 complex subunitB [Sesamum radiatum]|uniref:Actin-related protein 2/3 complex subunitB n=1 Tax=Sesamum radiatum TaxID=300843 RepID=A0AAW2SKV3_SESRA